MGCAEGKGCGAGLWSGLSSASCYRLPARLQAPGIEPGDDVMLGIQESALIRAAVYVYGIPLASLLAAALTFHALAMGELWSVVAGLAGLTGGFFLSRRLTVRAEYGNTYQPLVVGRAAPDPSAAPLWR